MEKFIIKENLTSKNIETLKKIIEELSNYETLNNSIYAGYPYFNMSENKSILKCAIINKKGIFIYAEDKNEFKRFKRCISQILLSSEEIADIMEEREIYQYLNVEDLNTEKYYFDGEDILKNKQLRIINSLIQNNYNLNKQDKRTTSKDNSIGYYIKRRSEEVANFDENQFNGIYTSTDSHIRIRGLAGSGKTIVMVKKMAYMHYKNKLANLCYVFYTISLKQYITTLFIEFYKELDPYGEPDFSKINIIHCWGGKYQKGFYSNLCDINGIIAKPFSQFTSLESNCEELLKTIKYKLNIYDYIFLDEAQDFGINFFKLTLKSLTENGKLIYAYDEMQSLGETFSTVPTKYSIFGNEKCEDLDLKTCYRTPKEILVTAHALGLGIYRNSEKPIVNMIDDVKVWESIGYEIKSGKLKKGAYVELARKTIYENLIKDPIRFKKFNGISEQYEYVTNEIKNLIEKEEVIPEDILIIDLDNKNIRKNSILFKQKYHEILSDNENFYKNNEWIKNINVVDKDNPKLFKLKDSIGYTTIYRAKGNEANIVFIVNCDAISSLASTSRNRLFTAMTRSKFIVYILDSNSSTDYKQEIDKVIENEYVLKFNYPTEDEMETIRTNSKIERTTIKTMDETVTSFRNLIGMNKDLELELLLKQTDKENIDELVEYLKGMKEKRK